MAVALVALSVVRERQSGAMDLFRIAPVRTTELVFGKVIAYGLLGALVAGSSLALLAAVLGVPMLGSLWLIAGVLGLLLLASLGLGLLISLVSDSERQAVQLSLLVLLASMFFSGFVLRIEEFNGPGPDRSPGPARHPGHPPPPGPDAAGGDRPALARGGPGRASPRSC